LQSTSDLGIGLANLFDDFLTAIETGKANSWAAVGNDLSSLAANIKGNPAR
jgi:hypothetical protein